MSLFISRASISAVLFLAGACGHAMEAPRAAVAPNVDGIPDDAAWVNGKWRDLKYLMVGTLPDPNDFSGRYKAVWTAEYLYLLAEITDDILIDTHANPLDSYWDDDALEVFIDEDRSGGLHQFDYNAFAYHIALDNQAIDIGPYEDEASRLAENVNFLAFPDHVHARWQRSAEAPHKLYWEARIAIFDESMTQPLSLRAGKKLGFMLAYCDADSAAGREHFMGDVDIKPVDGDRNLGYINASVFGELTLTEE